MMLQGQAQHQACIKATITIHTQTRMVRGVPMGEELPHQLQSYQGQMDQLRALQWSALARGLTTPL